jgi:tetratricopeptide (TPR) repeat protein
MKFAGRIAIACALSVLICLPASAEPRVGKYVKYDTGDYVIVTSRSAHQARNFVEDLAKFRVTLERALGKRATRKSFPTTIVICGARDWNAWLQPRRNIAGYFQQASFSNYMSMNGDEPLEQALQVMFHEYTHYYLASQFAGEYPPWFNEGLAELMGNARFEKGKFIVGVPVHLVYEARDGKWIPFERLIRVDKSDPEYQSHRLMPSFYAQSWLTLHYGTVENRDFGRQIIQYLNQLNTLVPQEEAARKSFGDLGAADKLLRDYSRRSTLAQGAMDLGEVQAVALPEGTPLDEVDAIAVLADLMLETRLAPDRIRPLVESLERRDPDKARAAIFSVRLADAADDTAAFEQAVARAEGALAATDWEQRRELASVLLTRGMATDPLDDDKPEDSKHDLQRALKWFAEAVSHNDQDIEALWGLGAAATHLGQDLDAAEKALVAAYKLAPSTPEIAVALANLKNRQEKPDEMIPFLEDSVRYASDLGTRRWAAETLVEVRKHLAERDKVDAENRRRREEYERMMSEYEKKYGKKGKSE